MSHLISLEWTQHCEGQFTVVYFGVHHSADITQSTYVFSKHFLLTKIQIKLICKDKLLYLSPSEPYFHLHSIKCCLPLTKVHFCYIENVYCALSIFFMHGTSGWLTFDKICSTQYSTLYPRAAWLIKMKPKLQLGLVRLWKSQKLQFF